MPERRPSSVLLLTMSVGAVVAAIITISMPVDDVDVLASGDSDLNLLYGHHPFLKMAPEDNVFRNLPDKSHGKYKKFVPEENVFDKLPRKMDAKKELRLWVIPGHKWHAGSTDSNVLAKPNKIYKWHLGEKGHGRSDDVNVLDGFDYEDKDPAYNSEYEIKY